MLPEGYTGLVLADSRRSAAWLNGLRDVGIDVVRIPATGKDSEKGSWQIAVVKKDEERARAFVSDVIRGHRQLPSAPALSPMGTRALLGIGVIMLTMLVGFLLAC